MHDFRLITFDEVRLITTPDVEGLQVFVARPTLHGRPRNLVPVEVQDREDRAIAHWIEKVDGLPATFQGTGLGISVTNHAGNDQVGVVEGCAESVDQGVAELSTFMHGIRNMRAAMAGHSTWR